MTYKETTEYLYNSTPVFEHVGASAYKEGLYNTIELDNHFGNPHRRYKCIHVAGTNGKGSVSHTLAAILQAAGLRVGLYTSPHLIDFRERIRINGEPVSEQYVIDFVQQERSFFEPLHPSFFELTTAMAFKYFAEQNIDIAIVEVGLGGRLDCTNIINPLLSVITNISFDHMQFLGDTLAKIASEKAGIIKHNIPVVIGEYTDETRPVFEKKAKELSAPILFASDNKLIKQHTETDDGQIVYDTSDYGEICGELGGQCQLLNTATILSAITVLKDLGLHIEAKDVRTGFANVCETTGLMGRWQKLQSRPLTICDTGHNVAGWQILSKQIRQQECNVCRIVFGMVDDKDFEKVMAMLPEDAEFYWTQASTRRAIPVGKIADEGAKHNLSGKQFAKVEEAYNAAIADAVADDFIFIGGSSYVVADLLTAINK